MYVSKESGIVQCLRVETRDLEIRVRSPAPAVIFDLVVACHSSKPGPCGTGLKIPSVNCVFLHLICSLKIPLCLFAKSMAAMGIERGLSTMGASTCTLERITLSRLKAASSIRRSLQNYQ